MSLSDSYKKDSYKKAVYFSVCALTTKYCVKMRTLDRSIMVMDRDRPQNTINGSMEKINENVITRFL